MEICIKVLKKKLCTNHFNLDVGEVSGLEQNLQRLVSNLGRIGIAFAQLHVGAHRAGLGPDVSFDHNIFDDAAFCIRTRKQTAFIAASSTSS